MKEINEKTNKNQIVRNKEKRRQMLKTMAVGGGAVIAGKTAPTEWTKPVIDSVLIPAHAQASMCMVSMTVQATALIGGGDTQIPLGNYAPGAHTTPAFNAANISVVPTISVNPGITDAFALEVNVNGGDINVQAPPFNSTTPPTSYTEVLTPDPANGVLNFADISVEGQDDSATNVTCILTPRNSTLCGGPLTIDITFPDGVNP